MRTPGRAVGLYVTVTVCLVGCGDTEPGAAQAPGIVIPAEGEVASTLSSTVVGQVIGLGLDRIEFPAPGDDPAERQLASRGPPASGVAESALVIDRSSPERLLDGALQALHLEDDAALARLSRPRTAQETLNEDDVSDARRRFLGPNTRKYWNRILAAVSAGTYQVVHLEGDRATVRVDVGGAAGAYAVQLRKGADGWYLAG